MIRQLGFTIIEWMVSMTIGLFLLGGLLSIYVVSSTSTHDSLDNSELQENGRIAMNILMRDLHYVGFWGDMTGLSISVGNGITLSTKANGLSESDDCWDDRDAGSFPKSGEILRSFWVARVNSSGSMVTGSGNTALDCLSAVSLQSNSDILMLKHVEGNSVRNVGTDVDASVKSLNASNYANQFFVAMTPSSGYFFQGSETSLPSATGALNPWIWPYVHHIYYVVDNNGIPELHRRELFAKMQDPRGALVRGVQSIHIQLAVDTTVQQDNQPDAYLAPASVSENQWNDGRVVGAKLFILMRASEPTSSYTNTNVYTLGDLSFDYSKTPDHYRRLLLESTINFNKKRTGS